jgi:hypothetical protein
MKARTYGNNGLRNTNVEAHIHRSDEAVYRLAKLLFDKGLLTFDEVVRDVFELYDLSEPLK